MTLYTVMGIGRCGSSLAMQALVAGGLDPGKAIGPYYEDERATRILPQDHRWLSEYDGKVIKVLHASHYLTREMLEDLGMKIKVLWIERQDRDEQVKSWYKFLTHKGKGEHLQHTTPKAMRQNINIIHSREKGHALDLDPRMLEVVFEDVLDNPAEFGDDLAAWVGGSFDAEKAATVVKPREKKCLDYMLEEEL